MAGSRCEDVNCGLGPLLVVLSLQEASLGALGFSVRDSSALRRSILKVSVPRDWTGSPGSVGSGDGSTAHFLCILLVKQVTDANLDSRGGKWDHTSQWESSTELGAICTPL